jgi:hypothetical protein
LSALDSSADPGYPRASPHPGYGYLQARQPLGILFFCVRSPSLRERNQLARTPHPVPSRASYSLGCSSFCFVCQVPDWRLRRRYFRGPVARHGRTQSSSQRAAGARLRRRGRRRLGRASWVQQPLRRRWLGFRGAAWQQLGRAPRCHSPFARPGPGGHTSFLRPLSCGLFFSFLFLFFFALLCLFSSFASLWPWRTRDAFCHARSTTRTPSLSLHFFLKKGLLVCANPATLCDRVFGAAGVPAHGRR